MFLFARRSAVLNQLQKSQPLDAIFEKSSEMLVLTENMEDKLLSKAVRIPILLSQVNSLLAGEKSLVDYNAVSKFIRLAENLDDELTLWATRLPSEWSYTAVINIKSFSNFEKAHSIYYPNQIHRYPNLYAARLWNFYRVYRIIIQSILCRLSSVYSVEYKQDEQSQIQSRISCDLASDICASVPFLLGYDLSNLAGMQSVKYPWVQPSEESYLWPQNFLQIPTSGLSKGKFSLIWPLHVASSAKFLPEVQRKWMRAQLQWMAHIGEAHARLILYAESQILYGGTESFRFDCV
ncbi:hypothetical protein GLAREA_09336 [Glarea lozoyensis ATCC 20868]|uniref:Uncharacterized protein n=1 Tax=Glarea lozoyensis (strain ATCC 20868 / MF5171) TaxID=1116229 RepID=S3D882_GLAL2|nr:uncharacterized protein GLAREA_09336 [Glarea lozoyensis ATCC 20868]EPE28216.1 hypothetical protein GLAREA_09336 [Glarea lozoyensis ATCC 20868]